MTYCRFVCPAQRLTAIYHFDVRKFCHRAARLGFIAVVLGAALPGEGNAQLLFIYDWNSPAGGSYASQLNWNPVGVPDSAGELARFQLNATYSVAIDTDYTVGSLAARQQGDVTLAFPAPTTFTPRKIYTTGDLSIDPTSGGTVTMRLSNGDVRVSGSTLVGRDTSDGQANLNLSRTLLTSAGALVGDGPDSVGRVIVDDTSRWNASGSLVLGGAGDAQLDINAHFGTNCLIACISFPTQGMVTSNGVVIAQGPLSDVTATIHGNWNTGDLIVGDAGEAEMRVLATQLTTTTGINVSSAGTLSSGTVSIATLPGSSGSVDVTGLALVGFTPIASAWSISDSLSIGGSSGAPGGDGELTVGFLNSVTVGSGMKVWPGGKLVMIEGGTLSVAGAANLGGTLQFNLGPTTNPQIGNEFDVLSAALGVTGTFDSTILPVLDSGLAWAVNYEATSVSLEVVAGLAGDYNQNGAVDAGDYTVWRDTLGSTTELAADGDGSSTVDAGDYVVWKTNFGVTGAAAATKSNRTHEAVPEPSGVALVASMALAIGVVCPRR